MEMRHKDKKRGKVAEWRWCVRRAQECLVQS